MVPWVARRSRMAHIPAAVGLLCALLFLCVAALADAPTISNVYPTNLATIPVTPYFVYTGAHVQDVDQDLDTSVDGYTPTAIHCTITPDGSAAFTPTFGYFWGNQTNGYTYEWYWQPTADGVYTIEFTAADQLGAHADPVSVEITITNAAPDIVLSPPWTTPCTTGNPVCFDATVSDANGNLGDAITFTVTPPNGAPTPELYGPYLYGDASVKTALGFFYPAVPGSYTLHCAAEDSFGAQADDATRTITVENPAPTVSVSLETAGEPGFITQMHWAFHVEAQDSNGTVQQVRYRVQPAADPAPTTSTQYLIADDLTLDLPLVGGSIDWLVPAGPASYKVYVIAQDNDGAWSEPAVQAFQTYNQAPEVTLSEPEPWSIDWTPYQTYEGLPIVATITDPNGMVDPDSAWCRVEKDGVQVNEGAMYPTGMNPNEFAYDFTPTEPGSYTVIVSATDDEQEVGAGTRTAYVKQVTSLEINLYHLTTKTIDPTANDDYAGPIGGKCVTLRVRVTHSRDITLSTIAADKAVTVRATEQASPSWNGALQTTTIDGFTQLSATTDGPIVTEIWERRIDTRGDYNTESWPNTLLTRDATVFTAPLFNAAYDFKPIVKYIKDAVTQTSEEVPDISVNERCAIVKNLNIEHVIPSSNNNYYCIFNPDFGYDTITIPFEIDDIYTPGCYYNWKIFFWPTRSSFETSDIGEIENSTIMPGGIGTDLTTWQGQCYADNTQIVSYGPYNFDIYIEKIDILGNVIDSQWYKSYDSGFASDTFNQGEGEFDTLISYLPFNSANIASASVQFLGDDIEPPLAVADLPIDGDYWHQKVVQLPANTTASQIRPIFLADVLSSGLTRDHSNRPVYCTNVGNATNSGNVGRLYRINFAQGSDTSQSDARGSYFNILKNNYANEYIGIVPVFVIRKDLDGLFIRDMSASEKWAAMDGGITHNTWKTNSAHFSGHGTNAQNFIEIALKNKLPYRIKVGSADGNTESSLHDLNKLINTNFIALLGCECGSVGEKIASQDPIWGGHANATIAPTELVIETSNYKNNEEDFMKLFYGYCNSQTTTYRALRQAKTDWINNIENGQYPRGSGTTQMDTPVPAYYGYDSMASYGMLVPIFN